MFLAPRFHLLAATHLGVQPASACKCGIETFGAQVETGPAKIHREILRKSSVTGEKMMIIMLTTIPTTLTVADYEV